MQVGARLGLHCPGEAVTRDSWHRIMGGDTELREQILGYTV